MSLPENSDDAPATPPSRLRLERVGNIAVVEINRPEVLNIIDAVTTQELGDTFDWLEADESVWAVVLTGAGDRAFCAGADMKAIAVRNGAPPPAPHPFGFAALARRPFTKPLIAAVNGMALGGGFEIVLACDIVVAEEHATFCLPEVRHGIIAAGGGLVRLAQQIPMVLALELAMTAESITAARAAEMGLVNRVVQTGTGREQALRTAETICANGPIAVRLSKKIMRAAASYDDERPWTLQADEIPGLLSSHDAKEGPRAFMEKRSPVWLAR